MNRRTVDPHRFVLLGGVVDWRRLLDARKEQQSLDRLLKERGLRSAQTIQLRWLSAKTDGYPTEPYTVWRRKAGAPQEPKEPGHQVVRMLGSTLVILDTPQVFVQVHVTGALNRTVTAWSGSPLGSLLVGARTATSASAVLTFSATAIASVVLPAGVALAGIVALDDSIAEDPSWEPVETVGLPVGPDWGGIGRWGDPQGFVTAPVDPVDAALDRFRRGAPLLGWPTLLRAGVAAPGWQLADPKLMVELVRTQMLPDLRDMVTTLPPDQHWTYEVSRQLPSVGGDQPAVLRNHPLESLLYGAATDGLASLVTGYGTAFEETLVTVEDRSGVQQRASFDYMVTARYEQGIGAEPGPVELAAILYAPRALNPPPAPAAVGSSLVGTNAPAGPDGPWAPILRVEWDALPDQLGLAVGAYAFAREDVAPATGVHALMNVRPGDTALQPLGLGMPAVGQTRRYATDDTVRLDSGVPANTFSYAVAHHDLFGLFSAWSLSPASAAEPPADRPTVTMARWDVVAGPPGGTCPATLVVDLAWDWSVRTPDAIHLVGRLYGQAHLGDGPADGSVPAGLATGTAAAGVPLVLDLAPDGSASVPTVSAGLTAAVQHLSLDGRSVVGAPLTNAGTRRYRLLVSGFQLDFATAGKLGMAVWARTREARSPGRVGPWSTQPVIASTADPRPPVVVNTRELVQLASLPDADGRHHAVLEWAPAPGAVAYFVYSCAEVKLLADRGLPDPTFDRTLEARLVDLRNAFEADPDRRSFARLNATAVPGTRLPVELPRGTKEIHLFVVLGLSDGQVESAWPQLGEPGVRLRFVAFAAPQVVAPSPPRLEVARVFDAGASAFAASVRVTTAPGVPVGRVDLHRVRVEAAAVEVESMGPPIARISASTPPFTVTPTVSAVRGEAQLIGTVRGLDPVPGSWRTVYYRAVAWGVDDAARGLYAGRSDASAVRSVVVPPAGPPDVEALTWRSGAGTSVVVDSATLAPVDPTVLGPHRVQAEVVARHPDGTSETILRHPTPPVPPAPPDPDADRLESVPVGAGVLWREATQAPVTPGGPARTPLHLSVPRTSADDELAVRLRVTDPLGRLTERTLTVPPGPVVQPPDLIDPDIFTIVGRGTVLTVATSVPDTDGLGRPYVLSITLTPRALTFPPARPQRVRLNLADIPLARAGDVTTDPAPIPVRRAPGVHGRTQITALLRAAGSVSVVLTAPDGTRATWSGTAGTTVRPRTPIGGGL